MAGDTQKLLEQLANGDQNAAEQLFPKIYQELHSLASKMMRGERCDHTLQPTALINEAYLRLARTNESSTPLRFEDLGHFMATAAKVMRQVLINHAKSRNAEKRGGGRGQNLSLDTITDSFDNRAVDLLALEDALQELKAIDPLQHELVELRFFGGFSVEECAKILSTSQRKLFYEWAHARSWLRAKMAST